jgi:nitroimidazol reductase NimA-like FMN-containing flavoprotein (pyridoxamine 5'-phosphate oxidase superfamily)
MRIPQSIRDLVATGPLARLVTLNPDGSHQVAVVWVGIDDDNFVFGHMVEQQKLRNVRRNPRVALSFLG